MFDKNGPSDSGAVRPTLITAFAFFYNTDSSLMFTGCWGRVCPSKDLYYQKVISNIGFNALIWPMAGFCCLSIYGIFREARNPDFFLFTV